MADGDQSPAALSPAAANPQEASAAAHPAPAAPAPAEQTAAAAAPAAAAAAAPAEAGTPASPAPAEAAAHTNEPTLLEKFDAEQAAKDKPAAEAKPSEAAKPADAKPEDKKPDAVAAEAKPAEAAVAEPAKPEPVAYEYTLPETITMDDALKGKVHEALDAFRADPTKGVQGLLDLHAQQMATYADHLAQEQHRVFGETRKNWNKEVLADEEIGGAGHQTAMGAIARVRDVLVPEKERASFENFLRITGAGDHPQFLKMLHRAARFIDEPQAVEAPTNIKPAPNNGRPPGNRRGVLYDHPSSSKPT
jgi:hypothetical protein